VESFITVRDLEARRLADLLNELADWLEALVDEWAFDDDSTRSHATSFFVNRILLAPAGAHRARAANLLTRSITEQEVEHEYVRLAELVKADISGFERKNYVNLSHSPNKAMNLNAYIGLLGGSFRTVERPEGTYLLNCAADVADQHIPDAAFLLTLDADSVVLSDYALRLVHVMQADARMAVAQTPYSAFPRAPTPLERTAGATTDIQYIAHQGSSYYNAAYWVGANALLRTSALRAIRTDQIERDHPVPVFIQDRTVIEDTGSTIDLIREGWKIHNHPERLAYSATPPDFGALIIQRRRWSNGGLIILPDLIRYWLAGQQHRARHKESLVRLHYLVSPATGSISVLVLLLYPFDFTFSVVWLPLAAGPYYYLYGRDLLRSGYAWSDLLRVYALNLLLLPVNLAGVLLSARQAATGRKSPFGRTPKVQDRTRVPLVYSGFNVLMFTIMIAATAYAIVSDHSVRAIFPMFNGAFYAYGLVAMMGFRATWDDVKHNIRQRLRTFVVPFPDDAIEDQGAPVAQMIESE
jgi:cellulose synthase (UDP-forming)